MIILFLFLFVSISNCYAQDLSPNVKNQHEDHESIDEILAEQREPCFKITDLIMLMSRILDDLKVCLLNHKENITDLDFISACTSGVKESKQNSLAKTETVYHVGTQDPGK